MGMSSNTITTTVSKKTKKKKTYSVQFLWLLLVAVVLQQQQRHGVKLLSRGSSSTSERKKEGIAKPNTRHKRNNVTAVVLVTRYLDDCLAERLQHLINTAQRDVWLMHSHANLIWSNKKRAEVEYSQHLLRNNITGLKGVINQQSTTEELEFFDTDKSGTSKSSFLRFVALQKQTDYEWVWHLEDDVFFTGPWHKVFDAEPEIPSSNSNYYDIIASGQESHDDWIWHQPNACQIQVSNNETRECRDMTRYYVRWSILRLSRRMAPSLLQDIQAGMVKGHHEAIMGPYCKWRNSTSTEGHDCGTKHLNQQNIGRLMSPGKTPRKEQSLDKFASSDLPLQPNQLYHPVKCIAHSRSENGRQSLRKWLT